VAVPSGPETPLPKEPTVEPRVRFHVSRGRSIPREVAAVVLEEDTFLVMSSEVELSWEGEHPVRVINKAREVEAAPLGSVVVQSGSPLALKAVVHDLSAEPICREEHVRAALDRIAAIAEERRLRTLATPLLGVAHGRLEIARVVELIVASLSKASSSLEAVWLVAGGQPPEEIERLLAHLEERAAP
jgi:hypothetical protein